MDRFGYAKTIDVSTYERNKEAADAENKYIIHCMNTDRLCIFTDKGQMHMVKVLDLPYGKFRDKGTPIDNVSNYSSSEENIVFIQSIGNLLGQKLLFASSDGMLKQVDGSEFDVSKRTTAATKLNDGAAVLLIQPVTGAEGETIIMGTEKGMYLRFAASDVPEKKKGAVGVRGMKIDPKDKLETVHLLGEAEEKNIEVKGKEIALHRLRVANRDGKGVKK